MTDWHPTEGDHVHVWYGRGKAARKLVGVVRRSHEGWLWDQCGRVAVELPGAHYEPTHWAFYKAQQLELVKRGRCG